ncbi:unnamed protein product [Fraxinus pennsylvanica]|uniref:Ferredoxin thioredoxin reductase alpha chain domain-containing protein n=1 Tax=Fraxinus pennsylvanica TaxID=56036 RepID=A0AAD1ZP63_9LAMI|nr:unnamed protein product [Fraxinus pennsylvanica]
MFSKSEIAAAPVTLVRAAAVRENPRDNNNLELRTTALWVRIRREESVRRRRDEKRKRKILGFASVPQRLLFFAPQRIHLKNPKLRYPFCQIKYPSRRRTHSIHFHPIRYVADSISNIDNQPVVASSSTPSSSATTTNSVSLADDSVNDDELKKAESIVRAKVRIKMPLKVYHVPKVPEYELTGNVGVVKQYVGVHKGKTISTNLPYKVELVVDEVLGRDGKPLKFLAHLRDDEFEFLD